MDEKRSRIGQDRLRTRTRNVEEERAPFHYRTQVLPAFYLTVPADELIGQPAPPLTFCLAERGQQYLVYSDAGVPFYLDTFDPVGEAFLVLFHMKAVLLPRQARDKHTENSKIEAGFPRVRWQRIVPWRSTI